MKGNRAALRYAKAVLDLAKEKNSVKEVNEDMSLIENTIASSTDLQIFIKSPVVNSAIKKNSLNAIFPDVHEITSNLFRILLENNRIELLQRVAHSYNKLFDETNNVQVATVTTVVPLNSILEEKIQAKVRELTGNEAKLINSIDESLLGGFILRVGDLEYNASIADQMETLKREFKNNTYISKLN